jgi:hypothetical protein
VELDQVVDQVELDQAVALVDQALVPAPGNQLIATFN